MFDFLEEFLPPFFIIAVIVGSLGTLISNLDEYFTDTICIIDSESFSGEAFRIRIGDSYGEGIAIDGKEFYFSKPFIIKSTSGIIKYHYDNWDSWEDVIDEKSTIIKGETYQAETP